MSGARLHFQSQLRRSFRAWPHGVADSWGCASLHPRLPCGAPSALQNTYPRPPSNRVKPIRETVPNLASLRAIPPDHSRSAMRLSLLQWSAPCLHSLDSLRSTRNRNPVAFRGSYAVQKMALPVSWIAYEAQNET